MPEIFSEDSKSAIMRETFKFYRKLWLKDLKKNGAIGSVSFGAERKFAFKHKETKEKVELVLEHGSLLVMKGVTQTHWLHRLPPTKRISTPRINLTFRTIIESNNK